MVGSIMIVGVLTCYALLYFIFDLKATQMNVQHILIQELLLYKFKLGHSMQETKNICLVDGDGVVDFNTVTKWLKIFCSSCKNHGDQTRLIRPKTMDFEAVLQVIKANLTSSTLRVSSKLSISWSSLVFHLHNHSKFIQSCQIVSQVTKILQNFWFIWVSYS